MKMLGLAFGSLQVGIGLCPCQALAVALLGAMACAAVAGNSSWIPKEETSGSKVRFAELQRRRWFGASGHWQLVKEARLIIEATTVPQPGDKLHRKLEDRWIGLQQLRPLRVLRGTPPAGEIYVATTLIGDDANECNAGPVGQPALLFLEPMTVERYPEAVWGPLLRENGLTREQVFQTCAGWWGMYDLTIPDCPRQATYSLKERCGIATPDAIVALLTGFVRFQNAPPDSAERRQLSDGWESRGGIYAAFVKDGQVDAWEDVAARFTMTTSCDRGEYAAGDPVVLTVHLTAPEAINVPFALHRVLEHYRFRPGTNMRLEWWDAVAAGNYGECLAVRRTPTGRDLEFRLDLLFDLRASKQYTFVLDRVVWNPDSKTYGCQGPEGVTFRVK